MKTVLQGLNLSKFRPLCDDTKLLCLWNG